MNGVLESLTRKFSSMLSLSGNISRPMQIPEHLEEMPNVRVHVGLFQVRQVSAAVQEGYDCAQFAGLPISESCYLIVF